MKTTLKDFPTFRRAGEEALESVSLYATRMEAWRRDFEKEAREILANLERGNHQLNIERNAEIDRGHRESARAYAELMAHNSGRIFSLKQLLGDLPKSQCNESQKSTPEAKP